MPLIASDCLCLAQGLENYSRHLAGRPAGAAPLTLLDYFPPEYLLLVDESHVALPQVRLE